MIGKGKKMAPLHVKTIVALSNLVNEPVRKDKKKKKQSWGLLSTLGGSVNLLIHPSSFHYLFIKQTK